MRNLISDQCQAMSAISLISTMLHMLSSAFVFKECQAFLEQPVMYTLPISGMPHTNCFSSLPADTLVLDVSDAMVTSHNARPTS